MSTGRTKAGVRTQARAVGIRAPLAKAGLAATALAFAAFALLALVSQAQAARDPSASAFLAGAVKPAMQQMLRKTVPGISISKVTCFVPTTSQTIQGKCSAKFTVPRVGIKGTYQTNAKLASNGRLTWSTTGRTCSDLRGRRASCTGETNTGKGLISAGLAERQLTTNGFQFQSAQLKVKTAICQGLKSAKWLHGKFDDVYAQLRCSVKAGDGRSYTMLFKMVGSDGYNLTNITRR